MSLFRKLTREQIKVLKNNNCNAENWDLIKVTQDFNPSRIHFTEFFGEVIIGSNNGSVNIDGLEKSCGISNAKIANCRIGNNVYIANIGSSVQNYIIEDNVIINNLTQLISENGAKFGNGVQISVINEAGGGKLLYLRD